MSEFTGNNQFSGLSVEERFWQKVDKKSDDECWEWIGSRHHQWKYGAFNLQGKHMSAHRYSWIIHFGEIPKGLLVCHKCDNPPCVNPSHLFLGTDKDNTIDKISKGRLPSAVGSLNSRAILSEEDVLKIKELKPNHSCVELGKMFGVHSTTIRAVIKGRNWKHVKENSDESGYIVYGR